MPTSLVRRTAAVCLVLALAAGLETMGATPSVSAGGSHSIALHADGTIRAWGDDSAGALGAGRSLAALLPIPVPGVSNVIAIAAGDFHTLALEADGTVWAWGRNANGQLGDGTTNGRSSPVPVAGLTGVVAIAAGSVHAVALKGDGTVWTWGANYVGQLGRAGDGNPTPLAVPGLTDVVAIAAGYEHTVALRRDGTVWSWGLDDDGQLGNGATTAQFEGTSVPSRAVGLAGVVQVAAGGRNTLARTADGRVWAWGDNSGGNLGDGTGVGSNVPIAVPGLTGVAWVASGSYSLAIKADGSAWAWGSNGYAQLGDGTYVDRPTPVALTGLPPIASASLAFLHSSAVAKDGSVWSWGNNDAGDLGDGTTEQRQSPIQSHGIASVIAVAVGEAHTVALKSDGSVWAWGDDGAGELGNGVRIFSTTPRRPQTDGGWIAVAAGGRHSVALASGGTVSTAGNNDYGQLGDGTRVNRATFGPVAGLTGVVEISAGYYHSLARKADGTVWAWGLDYAGRLGNGPDGGPGLSPVQVTGLTGAIRISAGGGHSLALRNDGTVWAWGDNGKGQLGDATTITREAPVRVSGLNDVVEIAAGEDHSLARTRDGSVWAWGGNYEGQLGDGTNTDRPTPVRVTGLAGAVALSAGGTVSAALTSDGSVWTWGANFEGQLGDGTFDSSTAPARLSGLDGVAAISVGSGHTLAAKRDGSLLAWGRNDFGQAGDGTLAGRGAPVVVVHEDGSGTIAGADWFLDLDPSIPTSIPADRQPVFLATTSGVADQLVASIRYRPQDEGSSGSVFVFALAPAGAVKRAPVTKAARASTRYAPKDTQDTCVLAQLTPSGALQAASASGLQPALTGILSAQGQAITVLANTPGAQLAGATFYVGYGASASAMIAGGTNRSVVSVPGATQCQAQRPQTGWWWNPLEDGRGFSIEVHGNDLFFASFLYDATGRSTWVVSSGAASLDGSFFSGGLYSARGGQTLGGPYAGFPAVIPEGNVTLAFIDGSHGTMVWPGGTVPIERFGIVPGGLSAAPVPNTPESGWWWNPDEAGRGFFLEWQAGVLDVAGYMYDDAGNPVWYIALARMGGAAGTTFSSSWLSYGGGQTLTGPWQRNHQVSNAVAPITIEFSAPDEAFMTLPNGRGTRLVRQRF